MGLSINGASKSIRNAAIAQFGSKIANLIFQLGIQAILARLLTPEEYGTVAILTVFTALFSVLSDAGLSMAIVRYQDLEEEDYRILFGFSLFFGTVLAVLFILVSYAVSIIYSNPDYIPLGSVLSLTVLFNSLNMVPNGLLQKEKKFKLIGLRLVAATSVVGIAVIFLAFLGFGCYAIILNSVLTSLFVLLWNVRGSHIKPLFKDFRPILRKVGRFSFFQFGSSAISWIATNADTLVVGKLFGSESLGYYNKAYSLYGYPNSILASSISSTLAPYFAPHQDDKVRLYREFTRVINKVSTLAMFCTVEMSICSSEVIEIVFGSTWAPAAPLLHVLAIAIYSQGMNQAHAPLLSATGRTDLLFRSTAVNTVITFLLIIVGGLLGSVQSLANCVAFAYSIEIILPIFFCIRCCLGRQIAPYVLMLAPDIIAGASTIFLFGIIGCRTASPFISLILRGMGALISFAVLKFILGLFCNKLAVHFEQG